MPSVSLVRDASEREGLGTANGSSVEALARIGIRRISTGPRMTQAMFGAVDRAAREILDKGTFSFIGEVTPFATLQGMFSKM